MRQRPRQLCLVQLGPLALLSVLLLCRQTALHHVAKLVWLLLRPLGHPCSAHPQAHAHAMLVRSPLRPSDLCCALFLWVSAHAAPTTRGLPPGYPDPVQSAAPLYLHLYLCGHCALLRAQQACVCDPVDQAASWLCCLCVWCAWLHGAGVRAHRCAAYSYPPGANQRYQCQQGPLHPLHCPQSLCHLSVPCHLPAPHPAEARCHVALDPLLHPAAPCPLARHQPVSPQTCVPWQLR